MEFKILFHKTENNQSVNLKYTPTINSGFNSYYIDKLKHLKTALEDFKSKDVPKNAKPYKIISPLSVSKDSELNKHFSFGTKQENYIIYELLRKYKLKGSIYSDIKNFKQLVDKLNVSGVKVNDKIDNADNIIVNSKVDFYKNFYNQEVKQLSVLQKTLKDCEKLKSGGNCIIKIYNIFLNNTINEIRKYYEIFDNIYIYKPETVDNYKTDKYLICLTKKNKKSITDKGTIKDLNIINTAFINEQTKSINEVINYINKRNYHGSDYNNYMETQDIKQKEFIKKMNK